MIGLAAASVKAGAKILISPTLIMDDVATTERKLQFRIGVNLGDVIIDRGELYGESVNVAARLESLAEAGGICISAAVYDQVKGKLDIGFKDLGAKAVKNIADPVHAYQVLLEPADARPVTAARFRGGRVIGAAAACLLLIAGGAMSR